LLLTNPDTVGFVFFRKANSASRKFSDLIFCYFSVPNNCLQVLDQMTSKSSGQ